jgi:hypothetical protein
VPAEGVENSATVQTDKIWRALMQEFEKKSVFNRGLFLITLWLLLPCKKRGQKKLKKMYLQNSHPALTWPC